MFKDKYYINEHNLFGEVLVNISLHKDCSSIKAFKTNKEVFSNAYIINDEIQLQIKYCTNPHTREHNNQDWIVYQYKFEGSEAIRHFNSKKKAYIGLLALNHRDNSVHRIFYYELSIFKYLSNQYDSIDLYTRKDDSPFVKVYSKDELIDKKATAWSDLPGILFK